MTAHRVVRTGTALLMLAIAASCSKSHSASTPTPNSIPLGATFHANGRLTGAVDLSGPYAVDYRTTDPARNSCPGVASAPSTGGTTFVVPFPSKLGRYHVNSVATVTPFHGAGEYGIRAFPKLQVTLTNARKQRQQFNANKRTTARLSVQKDGSGSFVFDKLSGKTPASLSGTITWTCK